MQSTAIAHSILLFGCGNMGRALLDGWLSAGADPARHIVADPHVENLPPGVRRLDRDATDEQFDTAIIAVKPQAFAELAPQLAALLGNDALCLSVLAGTTTATLQSALPGRRIVRLMPNLAAAIGRSPLGLWENSGDARLRQRVAAWVAPLGKPVWLQSEAQLDIVTALAGSGPAFVYRVIEAFAKAGEILGLDAETAAMLALETVGGAAELAAQATQSPRELAQRVTSPGGTTAAGLAVLDAEDALDRLILSTLKAARDRGVELSRQD